MLQCFLCKPDHCALEHKALVRACDCMLRLSCKPVGVRESSRLRAQEGTACDVCWC